MAVFAFGALAYGGTLLVTDEMAAALKRRGRTWGEQNAATLEAMRQDVDAQPLEGERPKARIYTASIGFSGTLTRIPGQP